MEINFENEKEIIENGDNGIFDNIDDMKSYLNHVILNKKNYIKKFKKEVVIFYDSSKYPYITDEEEKLISEVVGINLIATAVGLIVTPYALLFLLTTPMYHAIKHIWATNKVNNLIETLINKIETAELTDNKKEKTIENKEVDKFIQQIINVMKIAKEARYDGYMQDIIDLKKLSNDYIECNIVEKSFEEINGTKDMDWYRRLTDIEVRISTNMKNYKYKLQNTQAVNQEIEDTILSSDLTLNNSFSNLHSKQKTLKK